MEDIQNKREYITKLAIKANPEAAHRTIGLKDCLRAYEHSITIFGNLQLVDQLEVIQSIYGKVVACWCLALPDDITKQPHETVSQIFKLLPKVNLDQNKNPA